MVAANISELGASRFASVSLTTARVSSIGSSRRAVVVVLLHMRRVIGRVLQRVVLRDGGEVDFRIGAPVMAVIRWSRLHRGVVVGCVRWRSGAVSSARVARQRGPSERIGGGRTSRGPGG